MNVGTRDRILNAAAEVMRELGLGQATTKEIARAAGLSEAMLYKHFRDKEDLFLHVLAERMPPLTPVIRELPERIGKGSVRRNLEEVAAAAIEFYSVVFPMTASLFAAPRLLAAFQRGLAERGAGPHRPIEALARYIEAERDAGRLVPTADPPAIAALLMGACFHRAVLLNFVADPPATETGRPAPVALVDALCGPFLKA